MREPRELITDEANRITKFVGNKLVKVFSKVETDMDKLRIKTASLEGKLDEREEFVSLLLVYLKDEGADSEVIKKKVKILLAPTKEGLQIKAIWEVQKSAVAIEAGSIKSETVIKK